MKTYTPKVQQTTTYLEKYSQLSDECQGKPEKLRAILKQLNEEVGTYLSKKKGKPNQIKNHKELFMTPKKEVLAQEQINNIEILKRLKQQLHTQQKRLQILESKTCKQDLESKIQSCEESIKQLACSIENQKKINAKQGKEIAQLEDLTNGQNYLSEMYTIFFQLAISKVIEKSIQEFQLKNLQLIEQIESEQKKQIQFSEFQAKVRDKVQQKEQKSAAILEQDPQIEQKFYKLQIQIQNQERHKKVQEEKYLADIKLLRQDINYKSKQLVELENYLNKLHMEIIQINEQCQRMKDYQMKRSQQIRQRLKQSVNLNQLSYQANDSSTDQFQQVLTHSFTSPKQIDFSKNENEIEDENNEKQEQIQLLEKENEDNQIGNTFPIETSVKLGTPKNSKKTLQQNQEQETHTEDENKKTFLTKNDELVETQIQTK